MTRLAADARWCMMTDGIPEPIRATMKNRQTNSHRATAAWSYPRRRRLGGWILLGLTPILLSAQLPATAGWMASRLSANRPLAEAREALAYALATERLCTLGLARTHAHQILDAVLVSEADRLIQDAVRITPVGDRTTARLQAETLREATDRFQQSLQTTPAAMAALDQAVDQSLAHGSRDVHDVLRNAGCAELAETAWTGPLAEVEAVWVDGREMPLSAEAAAKVVGVNYKGLLVLIIPILIVLAVAAAAGTSAAPFIAGAAAIGLAFVLFADPTFLFGSKAEEE